MADQTLTLFLRTVGVDEAARGLARTAEEIGALEASARAGTAGINRLDAATEGLARNLAAIGAGGAGLDPALLAGLQAQVAGIDTALRAIESRRFDVRAEGIEGARAGFDAIRAAIAQAQAQLVVLRGQIDTVDDSPAVVNARRQFEALQQSITAAQARLRARVEAAGLSETAAEAQRATTTLQGAAQQGRRAFDSLLTGVGPVGRVVGALTAVSVAAGVARLAFEPLARAIAAPVRAAGEAELAVRRLNIALSSVGAFTTQTSQDLQRFAADVQATTGVEDEAVLGAVQVLTQIGGVRLDRIREATQAALDLSSALGTDLASAALILAKASEDNVQSLRRLGIVIDENVPRAQRFDAILAQIGTKLRDTATGEAQTAIGSFRILARSWGELLEAFGRPIAAPIASLARDAAELNRRITDALPRDRAPVDLIRDLRNEFRQLDAAVTPLDVKAGFGGFRKFDLPTIQFALDKGNADEIRAILDEIQQGIADVANAPAPVRGTLLEFFGELEARTQRALTIRLGLDTTQAEQEAASLASKIRPADIVARVVANTESVVASIEQLRAEAVRLDVSAEGLDAVRAGLEAPVAPIRVPFLPEFRAGDLVAAVTAATQEAGAAARLPEIVASVVPTLDADALEAAAEAVDATMKRVAARGGEAGVAIARSLAPALALFSTLAAQRARVLVEAPATDSLRPLLETVRAIRAEASKDPGLLLRLPNVSETAAATDVVAALRGELTALRSTLAVSPEQSARVFEQVEAAVRKAARAVPDLRGALEAFLAEQRQAFGIDLRVRVRREDVLREVGALVSQTQEALRAIGASPIRIADVGALARDGVAVERVAAELAAAIDAALRLGELDRVVPIFSALTSAQQENARAVERWSVDTDRAVAAAIDRTREFVDAQRPLFDARALQQRFDIAIQLEDATAAAALLDEIRAKRDALPGTAEIAIAVRTDEEALRGLRERLRSLRAEEIEPVVLRLELGDTEGAAAELAELRTRLEKEGRLTVSVDADLRNYRRRIAEVQRFGRAAFEQARDDARIALGDIGLDALAASIHGVYAAIVSETLTLRDVLVGIITTMIDEIIKQFARLIAIKIVQAILALGSGGAAPFVPGLPFSGELGRAPEPTPVPESAKVAPPLPPAVSVRPEVLVSRPEPVRIVPDLRVQQPAPVTVEPRVVPSVPAAVSVRPRIVSTEPAPVSVRARIVSPEAPTVSIRARVRALEPAEQPVRPRLRVIQPPESEVRPRVSLEQPPPFVIEPDVTVAPRFDVAVVAPPPVRVTVGADVPDEVRLPAPRTRVAALADLALQAPRARAAALAALVLAAPAVRVAALPAQRLPAPAIVAARPAPIALSPLFTAPRRQALQAPEVAFSRAAATRLPAPVAFFDPARSQRLQAPALTVGRLAPFSVLAPAARVAPLAPVAFATPRATVGRLAPVGLDAPAVALRGAPRALSVALPEIGFDAPAEADPITVTVPLVIPDLRIREPERRRETPRAIAPEAVQRRAVTAVPTPLPAPALPRALRPAVLEPIPDVAPTLRVFDRAVRALRLPAQQAPPRIQIPEGPPGTAAFLRDAFARDARVQRSFARDTRGVTDIGDIVDRILPRGRVSTPTQVHINGPMDSRDVERSMRSGPLARGFNRLARTGRWPA